MRLSTAVCAQAIETLGRPEWCYERIVESYAVAYWLAGAGDRFIRHLDAITVECRVPTRGERLSRLLAQVYPSPYDQYLLAVSLGTSALWYAGAGYRLLAVLAAPVDDSAAS